jgi:hypothetical protein
MARKLTTMTDRTARIWKPDKDSQKKDRIGLSEWPVRTDKKFDSFITVEVGPSAATSWLFKAKKFPLPVGYISRK